MFGDIADGYYYILTCINLKDNRKIKAKYSEIQELINNKKSMKIPIG